MDIYFPWIYKVFLEILTDIKKEPARNFSSEVVSFIR